MSDDQNISYSYQLGSAAHRPNSAKEETPAKLEDNTLFAFSTCDALDMPDGNVLLVNLSNGKQLSVSRDVSIALNYCQEFRSLTAHAKFLVSYMPELGGDEAGVAAVLTSVKDAGLMVSAVDTCQRINRVVGSASELPPSNVFIISCDRPTAVERLLESMLGGAKLGPHKRLYLVDDSRDQEKAAQNEALVASFNRRSPKKMAYMGGTEQNQLLDALITALPQHEQAIRFLIDRQKWASFKSYGLARTVCLLLSVGERCIIMDDDVICAALASPHKKTGIHFTDKIVDAGFYSSSEAWKSTTVAAAEDPLVGHAKCLGMGLTQAIAALGMEQLSPQDLNGVDINLVKDLQANSKVLVSQSGSLGDPGTMGNSWLINLEPESLNRLFTSPGGLGSAFQNRQYWLGRTRPTFSKYATMSQVTGLDNSQTLPPYFPVFRGEDLIFGKMLDFLYPDSLALEYDWAVPHMPTEERTGASQGSPTSTTGGITLCVDYIGRSRPADHGVSFQTRMKSLCLALQELSENSVEGISTIFQSELARTRSEEVRSLNNKINQSAHQPKEWQAYLQRCLAENVKTLQTTCSLKDSSETPRGMSDETAADGIRRFAGQYALALQAWPEIRDAAAHYVATQ